MKLSFLHLIFSSFSIVLTNQTTQPNPVKSSSSGSENDVPVKGVCKQAFAPFENVYNNIYDWGKYCVIQFYVVSHLHQAW